MTLEANRPRARGRALIWRLAAGTGAAVAALAIPALPAAGAATAPHGGARVGPDIAAVTTPGTLRGWGFNGDGEIGNGTTNNSDVPVKVKLPSGTKVTQVRQGCSFTVALTSTGSVLTWGDNSFGQLGNGAVGGRSTVPVKVSLPSGTKVTQVRAGCLHALALTSTGRVLAWGYNFFGQLGDGLNTDSNVPVFVDMPQGVKVKAITAGQYHNLALASNGTAVFAWGRNQFGQLGNGTFTDSNTPVLVTLGGVTLTGLTATFGDSLALTTQGQVLTWGDNSFGELGDDLALAHAATPVFAQVPAGVKVVGAVGGSFHFLARTDSGDVLAWGDNTFKQLGDGSFTQRNVPTFVDLPPGATATTLGAGNRSSLALTSQGQVLAWGIGSSGELGNGTFVGSDTPVQTQIPANLVVTALGSGPGNGTGMAIVHKK
jgi:alpha-tubulin suppressor-like RCC1 family protein